MIRLEVAVIRMCRYGESLSDAELKQRTACMVRRQHIASLGYQIDIFDRDLGNLERVYYIMFDTEEDAVLFKLKYL